MGQGGWNMSGKRKFLWVVTALGAIAIIVVVVLAFFVSESTTGVVTEVVIAVTAIIADVLAVIGLLRDATTAESKDTGDGAVEALGRRAVAVGRDSKGNAIGKRSRVTGRKSVVPPPAPVPEGEQEKAAGVRARGRDTLAVGRDSEDNAIGNDSEVS